MKRATIYILFCIFPVLVFADSLQQKMEAGNKVFEQKQYNEAVSAYESILDEGSASDVIYYNLGNAYFRTGNYAKAILNYERALRLNPNDTETKENLELAQSRTQDKIDALPSLLITRVFRAILHMLSLTEWKIATLVLFALMLAAVVVFLLSTSYGWRKWSLIVSIASFIFVILSGIHTFAAYRALSNDNEAIVMPTMISVKSSPDAGSVEKFILHSGTKVEISEEVNGWLKISIADGNKGWLKENEIERI